MVSRPGAGVEGRKGGGGGRRLSFLRHARSTQGQLKLTAIYCISIMVSHPLPPPPPPPLPKPRTWNTGESDVGCSAPAHSRFTVSFMEHNGGRSNQRLTISSMDECIIRSVALTRPRADVGAVLCFREKSFDRAECTG